MHRQHHLVGIPIGEGIHADRENECDQHAGLAAKQVADGKEQSDKSRQQNSGPHHIHQTVSVALQQVQFSPYMMGMARPEDKSGKLLPAAAQRALAEAEARRKTAAQAPDPPKEVGGPKGPEPTRFGDWEIKGITSDF